MGGKREWLRGKLGGGWVLQKPGASGAARHAARRAVPPLPISLVSSFPFTCASFPSAASTAASRACTDSSSCATVAAAAVAATLLSASWRCRSLILLKQSFRICRGVRTGLSVGQSSSDQQQARKGATRQHTFIRAGTQHVQVPCLNSPLTQPTVLAPSPRGVPAQIDARTSSSLT